MRFLADENCDFTLIRALRDTGHDMVSVSESFQGCEDEKLIELAQQENRLFLTEDKDFGEKDIRRYQHARRIIRKVFSYGILPAWRMGSLASFRAFVPVSS